MPLDIIIAEEQNWSTGTNTPAIEDWSFSPDIPIETNYFMGDTSPSDISLSVTIRDYLTQFGDDYPEYYLKPFVIDAPTGSFNTFTGDVPEATGDGYLLSALNLDTTITIGFQNLNLASEGTVSSELLLNLNGKDAAGNVIFIESKSIFVKTNIINLNNIFVTPQTIPFGHVLNETLPAAKPFNVYCNSVYVLRVDEAFTITSPAITNTSNLSGTNIYTASGNGEFNIVPNSLINNKPIGINNYQIKISKTGDIKYVDIPFNLFEEHFIEYSPSSLEYFAIKEIEEAQVQYLNVSSSGTFNITFPDFLQNEDVTQLYAFNSPLPIVPLNTSNLSAGIYLGNIIITFNSVDYFIPIKYTVAETIVHELNENGINFTESHNTIASFFYSDDYRVKINYLATLYSYGFGFPEIAELDYSLSLFNNRVSEFIGQRIRNIMNELDNLNSIALNSFQDANVQDASLFIRALYKPTELSMAIDFYNTNTSEIDETLNFIALNFLAGRKPKKHFANTAILSYSAPEIKVTVNSEMLLSFYKNQSHGIRIYKNGVLETVKNHNISAPGTYVYKHKFDNYSQGDCVEIRIYKNETSDVDSAWYNNIENYISQKYVVFPEEDNSCHIIWENEYEALSSLEFTGSLTLGTGRQATTRKIYKDFVEVIAKERIEKNQSITINTGHILKGSAILIDELADAKRAWVIFKDQKQPISLVPKNNELVLSDTDTDLYTYEVEFEINFNNENEIYQ